MNDLISRKAAIDALWRIKDERDSVYYTSAIHSSIDAIRQLPSVQPKRKKNAVQKFHDYQVKWLKSHYDIELDPQLEKMIVQFLHDTANCYMMEVEHDCG